MWSFICKKGEQQHLRPQAWLIRNKMAKVGQTDFHSWAWHNLVSMTSPNWASLVSAKEQNRASPFSIMRIRELNKTVQVCTTGANKVRGSQNANIASTTQIQSLLLWHRSSLLFLDCVSNSGGQHQSLVSATSLASITANHCLEERQALITSLHSTMFTGTHQHLGKYIYCWGWR